MRAIIAFISFVICLPVFGGETDPTKQALLEIKKGSYSQALALLERVSPTERASIPVHYWTGFCQYKLQAFDLAATNLEAVVSADAKREFEDAPYLLGQSLYASQEFKKARNAFKLSADRNYKKGASLYYIGYVSNVLDEENEALKRFNEVLALPADDSEMKQAAQFQIGEVYFESADKQKDKRKQRSIFLNSAIPAYESTVAMDEKDVLANQAKGRMDEIRRKLGQDVPRTSNGRPVPLQPYMVRISQDFKYDTNIINQPDDRLIKVTNTAAPFEKTSLFVKYELLGGGNLWWALTPELSTDATFHGRRGESGIYSNDNTSINPAIRTRFDHKIHQKPYSGLVEYEYAFSTRDYQGRHAQLYYTKSSNLILGERGNLLKWGSTTLKANLKLAQNANHALNAISPGVSLGQNWALPAPYVLNTTLGYEMQRTNNTFYDLKNYKANLSYGLPKIIWNTTVDFAFAFTLVDTMSQRDTRGYEKNYSPSLTLTRSLDKNDHFAINANYAFTKNSSKDTVSYAYSKHVVGMGAQLTF